MPVIRKGRRQSSLREKMLVYDRVLQAWRNSRDRAPLGFANFQVLTVTTTPQRVEHLVRAHRATFDGRGSNTFLFSDTTTIQRQGVLDAAWKNGRGEAKRLFPEV